MSSLIDRQYFGGYICTNVYKFGLYIFVFVAHSMDVTIGNVGNEWAILVKPFI